MKLVLITTSFLTAVACVHMVAGDPYSYPAPQNKEDCMQLFEDVLDIQAERARSSDKMSEDTKKYNSGKMSKRSYHRKRLAWLAVEGRLRKLVTYLYDIGYENGCFSS